METADFLRARMDAMINLKDPLAVLAARFERQERAGQILEGQDAFGPTLVLEVRTPAAPVAPSCRFA